MTQLTNALVAQLRGAHSSFGPQLPLSTYNFTTSTSLDTSINLIYALLLPDTHPHALRLQQRHIAHQPAHLQRPQQTHSPAVYAHNPLHRLSVQQLIHQEHVLPGAEVGRRVAGGTQQG